MTVFRSRYILRAHHIVEDADFAAGVIHSHPQGFDTFSSPSDDDMDDYYGQELERYGKGQPYMSIIFARDRDGSFYFTGRVYDNGEWYPVTDILTVGDELEHDYCQVRNPPAELTLDTGADAVTAHTESFTARLGALLGKAASKRLSRSTVGVLGCSGTGSPTIHVLARAGVGRFILVDPQRLSHSNVERVHGSRFDDFRLVEPPTKVECLARLIKEINPDAEVICIRGNVLDDAVLDALLQCDLLLGCADSQHCRAALGDLASHYRDIVRSSCFLRCFDKTLADLLRWEEEEWG